MKKVFVTNLALVLVLNLLIKPFWIFGIDLSVQNLVGTSEYGLYASLFNFSIILNILLDFGITNFNNKNIAQHNHLLAKYFSNIFVLKSLLGLVYAVVCISVAMASNYELKHFHILLFLIFNQFILSFILYLRSNIAGLQMFKTDSLISVTDRLVMMILCGILLITPYTHDNFKIEWFVYSQTVGYLFSFFLCLAIVIKKAGRLRLNFDKAFLLIILKQSYPFALLTLLMSLYTRIDMVMLERMLPDGANQAGIYAQAFRILDSVSMFAYLFATLLLPMFARMIRKKESLAEMVQLSASLLVVPSIIFACVTAYYSNEILSLLCKNHPTESAAVYSILILGFVPIATTYIFGTLLTANGSLKALNIMACVGVTLNIGLNFLFIPFWQAKGTAISSLTTQLITALVQIFIAQRIFMLRTNWKLLCKILFVLVFVLALLFSIPMFIALWQLAMILTLICSFAILFALRIINLKGLIAIVRTKED